MKFYEFFFIAQEHPFSVGLLSLSMDPLLQPNINECVLCFYFNSKINFESLS